jgi:hypothetical protein
MEEITVVRKRSRVWPVLITLLLLALIVLGVLWLMGSEPTMDVGWNELMEIGRSSTRGTT